MTVPLKVLTRKFQQKAPLWFINTYHWLQNYLNQVSFSFLNPTVLSDLCLTGPSRADNIFVCFQSPSTLGQTRFWDIFSRLITAHRLLWNKKLCPRRPCLPSLPLWPCPSSIPYYEMLIFRAGKGHSSLLMNHPLLLEKLKYRCAQGHTANQAGPMLHLWAL